MGSGNIGIAKTFSVDSSGNISSVISALVFEDIVCQTPTIIKAHDGIFAVAYTGPDYRGYVGLWGLCKTFEIDNNGNIGSFKGTLVFETDGCWTRAQNFLHIDGDVFAFAYQGPSSYCRIRTCTIDSSGNLGPGWIDTLTIPVSQNKGIDLIHCTGDLYTVAFQQLVEDTQMHTFTINSSGNISSLINSKVLDTASAGFKLKVVPVNGNVYAVAYRPSGGGGRLETLTIQPGGQIGGVIASAAIPATPYSMIGVSGNVYAYAYQGSIRTQIISDNGTIGAEVDSLTVSSAYPHLIHVQGDIYALAHTGSGVSGVVKTIDIVTGPSLLLQRYAPVLYLHEQEDFLPREIYSMLNESNLRDLNDQIEIINPSLDYLDSYNGTQYFLDMRNASPNYKGIPPDVPDEPGRFDGYPFVTYGREYEPPTHPDKIVLQYWFFYPYNNWATRWLGTLWDTSNHEGDWEMVTIVLDKATETPQWLTCAQHRDGKKYDWQDVGLIGQTHPKIFAARGSHSSLADDEDPSLLGGIIVLDVTSGNGTALYPEGVDPLEITGTAGEELYILSSISPVPNWVQWQGWWGDIRTDVTGANGPPGPANQGDKWDNPVAWSENPRNPYWIAFVGSPVDLHAYDPYGNHVGLTEAGEIEAEIPGTYVYRPSAEEHELMWIYTAEDLRYEIEATAAGEFDFVFARYIKAEDKEIGAGYEDVPITENTTATVDVSPANPEFVMGIDLDGDGTVDEYRPPTFISEDGITNYLPIADANGPYTGQEGSPISFNGTASYDPDGTIVSYEWDLDCDGVYDDATGATPPYTWSDDYSGCIGLKVTDDKGATNTEVTTVSVNNVAPTLGEISAPIDPVEVGTEISANATFGDPGIDDTHVAIWDWGDSSTSEGIINEVESSVSGNHTYSAAGVYTVTLIVTDDDGGSGESIFQYMVIYDPGAGFITGGGWINSPEGAYLANPTLTGKANLGFNCKYHEGGDVPTGETQFHFKEADLKLHSTGYEWLVINGAKAIFQGEGTVNGDGSYKFQITVIDADVDSNDSYEVDLFRIKIWVEIDGNEVVIYDSALGNDSDEAMTELGGGSIKIH